MGDVYQKLRDSARGQECTLRLPGICLGGTETTVLAHLPSGIGLKGMGMKTPDYWSCFSCGDCHDAIDGRGRDRLVGVDLAYYAMPALQRTWQVWFAAGLIRVAGDDERPSKHKSSKILPRPERFRR